MQAFLGTFHLDIQCWNLKYDSQATHSWCGSVSVRYFQFLYFIQHGSKKSVSQDRAACKILPKIKHSPLCKN